VTKSDGYGQLVDRAIDILAAISTSLIGDTKEARELILALCDQEGATIKTQQAITELLSLRTSTACDPSYRCTCLRHDQGFGTDRHTRACAQRHAKTRRQLAEGQPVTPRNPSALCPNCESEAHARCCSWCGQVHKPTRLHHEHCSAKCDRSAANADRISAKMEENT